MICPASGTHWVFDMLEISFLLLLAVVEPLVSGVVVEALVRSLQFPISIYNVYGNKEAAGVMAS